MPLHHYTGYYWEFDAIERCEKNHVVIQGAPIHRRGDRLHLTNAKDGAEIWRDIIDVKPNPFGLEGSVGLGLLDPAVNLLTQFSLTNERGQTFAFWIGDTRELQVGNLISLFDSFSDWTITGRWTSLTPKNVPDPARIGFVKEIFNA